MNVRGLSVACLAPAGRRVRRGRTRGRSVQPRAWLGLRLRLSGALQVRASDHAERPPPRPLHGEVGCLPGELPAAGLRDSGRDLAAPEGSPQGKRSSVRALCRTWRGVTGVGQGSPLGSAKYCLATDISLLRQLRLRSRSPRAPAHLRRHGGRIDLLCYDVRLKRLVVNESKNVPAGRNTRRQISTYLRWVHPRVSIGDTAHGRVIARGFDARFHSSVATSNWVSHLHLQEFGFE